MRTKHYVAAFAVLTLLAGCGEQQNQSTQSESITSAITNQAKEGTAHAATSSVPGSAAMTPAPPAKPPTNGIVNQ